MQVTVERLTEPEEGDVTRTVLYGVRKVTVSRGIAAIYCRSGYIWHVGLNEWRLEVQCV